MTSARGTQRTQLGAQRVAGLPPRGTPTTEPESTPSRTSRKGRLGRTTTRLAVVSLALLLAGATGCSDAELASTSPPDESAARELAYDQTWQIATHNSYWVDRGIPNDLFASGVGERISDQLLLEGTRTLEIDIHAAYQRPGVFTVFHTLPGNSLCAELPDCLSIPRLVHRALPRHEVVTVVIELKGLLEPTFDATHTIADLDRIIEDELGAMLFRPADLLERCRAAGAGIGAPDPTLAECVTRNGWPSLAELRGRVIVTLLGNWDELGGAQATRDWLDYATSGPLRDRAAFPMASSWKLTRGALTPRLQALVSQDDLDRALAQSAFLQIEDLADPRIDPFLTGRGVIRVDGAFTAADQIVRRDRGMQLLQTDFPWETIDGAAGDTPLRPLPGRTTTTTLREPGSHVWLAADPSSTDASGRIFARREAAMDESGRWETVVASRPGAVGCLRAATNPAAGADGLSVCRVKTAEGGDAERVSVMVERCVAGSCEQHDWPGPRAASGGPGDLLALEVSLDDAGRAACVRAFSTDRIGTDLEPQWTSLGDPLCFTGALRYRGLERRAAFSGDDGSTVLFAGTRAWGPRDGEPPREIVANDLEGVSAPGSDPDVRGRMRNAAIVLRQPQR